MSTARDAILGRLRHALADPGLPFPPRDTSPLAPAEHMQVTHLQGGRESAASRFRQELEALHGTCEIASSPVTARLHVVNQVQAWCTAEQKSDPPTEAAMRILVWPDLDEFLPGLAENLESRGYHLHAPEDIAAAETRRDIQQIAIGITAADAAFATTGSCLLKSGYGHSRIASLLPLHHLVLIPQAVLWANVEAWLEHEAQRGMLHHTMRDSANLTVVSGPSKSADIESRLIWGVHGPRHVHAVVF